ncbi:hypothetical protein K8R32_04835 [bacterium]|nr:hypothetical protein [bacterium]
MLVQKVDKKKNMIVIGVLVTVVIVGGIMLLKIFVFKGNGEEEIDLSAAKKSSHGIVITEKDLKIKKLDTILFEHKVYNGLQKKDYEYIEEKDIRMGKKQIFLKNNF